MPVTPIWCTGRSWPNAPATARSGTVGRGPPHFLGVLWSSGNGVWAPFDNIFQTVQHVGFPFAGVNAFSNWNWIDAAGGKNINIKNLNDASGFYLQVQIIFTDFGGPKAQYFETNRVPWFTWPSSALSFAVYTPKPGDFHNINDTAVQIIVLPYASLPAGACKVWP